MINIFANTIQSYQSKYSPYKYSPTLKYKNVAQIKKQEHKKTELPPIFSVRKSCLQDYTSIEKNHQSNQKAKTITQKILDLSKKRKFSTIDVLQSFHMEKVHMNQNLQSLTQQQKQLLASKQFKKPLRTQQNSIMIEISTSQSIIQKLRKLNEKKQKSNKFENQKIIQKNIKKIRKQKSLQNQSQQQNKELEQKIQQFFYLKDQNHNERYSNHKIDTVNENCQIKSPTNKLSFQISKNQKSLHFQRENIDKQEIMSLIKRRRFRGQRISLRKLKRGISGSVNNLIDHNFVTKQSNTFKSENFTALKNKDSYISTRDQKACTNMNMLKQNQQEKRYKGSLQKSSKQNYNRSTVSMIECFADSANKEIKMKKNDDQCQPWSIQLRQKRLKTNAYNNNFRYKTTNKEYQIDRNDHNQLLLFKIWRQQIQ